MTPREHPVLRYEKNEQDLDMVYDHYHIAVLDQFESIIGTNPRTEKERDELNSFLQSDEIGEKRDEIIESLRTIVAATIHYGACELVVLWAEHRAKKQ